MLFINYRPAFEHPVHRALSMFLAMISLLPLMATFNHAPHYAGMLPSEFVVIPIILVSSALMWCKISIATDGAITLTWIFAGMTLKTVKGFSFKLEREKKYLRVVLDGKNQTPVLLSDKSPTAFILSQVK